MERGISTTRQSDGPHIYSYLTGPPLYLLCYPCFTPISISLLCAITQNHLFNMHLLSCTLPPLYCTLNLVPMLTSLPLSPAQIARVSLSDILTCSLMVHIYDATSVYFSPEYLELCLIIMTGRKSKFLDITDAMHTAATSLELFRRIAQYRNNCWWSPKHGARHSLGLWSRPLIIYDSFLDWQQTRLNEDSSSFIEDGYYAVENPNEPDADWMAYMRFRYRIWRRNVAWQRLYQ